MVAHDSITRIDSSFTGLIMLIWLLGRRVVSRPLEIRQPSFEERRRCFDPCGKDGWVLHQMSIDNGHQRGGCSCKFALAWDHRSGGFR
jgi:ribosomal protein L15E